MIGQVVMRRSKSVAYIRSREENIMIMNEMLDDEAMQGCQRDPVQVKASKLLTIVREDRAVLHPQG